MGGFSRRKFPLSSVVVDKVPTFMVTPLIGSLLMLSTLPVNVVAPGASISRLASADLVTVLPSMVEVPVIVNVAGLASVQSQAEMVRVEDWPLVIVLGLMKAENPSETPWTVRVMRFVKISVPVAETV